MTTVPAFVCPKCGAIADVTHKQAYTEDDLAEQLERNRSSDGGHYFFIPNFELLANMRAGITYGEHLSCRCTRCGYWWPEQPRDATDPNEPTPIYDGLRASS